MLSERARRPDLGTLVDLLDAEPAAQPTMIDGRPPSAVLAPLYEGPNGPELLLTRRAWHLRSHTGEVCFPGGRQEPDDPDLAATALRETAEEIDLAPEHVELVGFLEPLATVSSPAAILPHVGLLDGRPEVRPDPGEVDGILHVPFVELLDPEIFREEIWQRPHGELVVTFFELEGDTLWGATARMVRSWLERLVALEEGRLDEVTGRG